MTTRTSTNLWLDVASLVVMIGLAATGGLIHFVLPAGTGHSHALLGFGRHDLGQLHFYLAVAAIVLLALHILLHWNWICCVVGKAVGGDAPSRRARTMWGMALLLGIAVFLGGGLWWASCVVQQSATERGGRGGRAHLDDTSLGQTPIISGSHGEAAALPEAADAPEPTVTPFESRPSTGRGGIQEKHLEECPAGASINGRISLMEAARICGVSVRQMKEHLNLPTDIDHQEQLGRLKRRYGLDIHAVRRLACR